MEKGCEHMPGGSWETCIAHMKDEGYSQERAERICGSMKEAVEKAGLDFEKDEFPGGFEGCVDHMLNKPDFEARGGKTKRESAEALCAWIARKKYGPGMNKAEAEVREVLKGDKLGQMRWNEVNALAAKVWPFKKQPRI